MDNNNSNSIITLLFDSGKIDDCCYGNVVFENIVKGKEITYNSHKIILSMGDVLNNSIYDDITPFIIRDELCTITRSNQRYSNTLFAILLEDVEEQIAINIDTRLKSEFPAYIGMTSINIKSSDMRKQFWKSLIRTLSIESETITYFGLEEEGVFFDYQTIQDMGFRINFDGFPDEYYCYNKDNLFSTRQSTFIQTLAQLELLDGRSDSDRGIVEMNYSLVKEVEISGVQLWKAIEDISHAYIPKEQNECMVIDYIFTSLYQASQGLERLLKIIIELLMYNNTDEIEKKKANNLLLGHKHTAMFDFISQKEKISLNPKCRKLLNIISNFYLKARYNRFSFNSNNNLELTLLRDFGRDIKTDNDFDEQIKHLYGKSLGQIAQAFYKLIEELSHRLNIYVYELHCESVANFAFFEYYGEDLYTTLKRIELAKKELLWYIMKNGNQFPETILADEIPPLPFEQCDVTEYVKELITNDNSCSMLYDFVSSSYDELVEQDKSKWKNRINAIDMLVGNSDILIDEDYTNEN